MCSTVLVEIYLYISNEGGKQSSLPPTHTHTSTNKFVEWRQELHLSARATKQGGLVIRSFGCIPKYQESNTHLELSVIFLATTLPSAEEASSESVKKSACFFSF